MLAMAMPWLFVLELVMYAGCFVCGIIAAALLTITQGHFSGQCLLYGSVHYNTSTQSLDPDTFSSPSLCYFIAAISISVAVCCFSFILYWAYSKCMGDRLQRETLWLNVTLGVCGVFLFFLLVSGCILRVGRDRLCLSVLQSMPLLDSCEQAENETWAYPYSGSQFYTGLHNTEKSVWVNFFFWVVIVAVVTVQRRWGSEFRVVGEDADWSSSETEPFFHRPSRPQ
ncbi:transmembrane protein 179B [Anguilla anguilla]|uniref:transmembrane protein 179B n=1 Tax=Anguilla anguilla TaxID=7936 RepID=UPI0015A7F75B|nr:transmembrane protein 179B [Anguilla anguilla]XP_035290345.1 transmembrane protein 179B [Anguilla anguilla]